MLKEAQKAMRVTASLYDSDIMDLLIAGARDLEIAGVVIPGRISYTVGTDDAVTDTSAMKDKLVQRALITYARAHFGSPADYDRLAESYETQKVQLMHAAQYTRYDGNGGDCG